MLYKSTDELEKAIETFFDANHRNPTITGLALELGFESRQSYYDYIKRADEYSYILKRAKTRIESIHEARLFEQTCVGSIFWLNQAGWKHETHVDHTTQDEKINSIQVEIVHTKNQGEQGT